MTHKKNANYFFVLVLFFFFQIVSCQFGDPEPDFRINGENSLVAGEGIEADIDEMVHVNSGDLVTITDASSSDNKINSREWDITGNGEVNSEFSDRVGFKTELTESGKRKITYWINGTENYISKWVYVNGGEATPEREGEESSQGDPEITFISPAKISVTTNKSTYEVKAELTEVWSDEEVALLLRGDTVDVEFDVYDGTLTKKISLIEGDNEVELLAMVDDKIFRKAINVKYEKPEINSDLSAQQHAQQQAHQRAQQQAQQRAQQNNEFQELMSEGGDLLTRGKYADAINKYKQAIAIKGNDSRAKNKLQEAKQKLGEEKDAIDKGPKYVSGKTGYAKGSMDMECSVPIGTEYAFSVTPKADLELKYFSIFVDACGRVQFTLIGPDGSDHSFTQTVSGGENLIELTNLDDTHLNKGKKYNIKMKTIARTPSCRTAPNLMNADGCSVIMQTQEHLDMDNSGKKVVFDLRYSAIL